jgi:hypothetical protein
MHHTLLVASPLAVVCLVLPAVPAAAQSRAALIEDNEAAAIADLQTIISAEAAYQAVNAGFYDRPACLLRPSSCIPGYPAEAPFFLDAALASLMVKDGYGRAFFTKPPAQKPGKDASLTSAEFYAVILWPDEPGKTGRRGFCGDADGIICFNEDGSMPKLSPEGRCPWEEREGKPAGCEVLH